VKGATSALTAGLLFALALGIGVLYLLGTILLNCL
jgi:hypothetical protein